MTNSDALIISLAEIHEDHIAEGVAHYINCPSSEDCTYDGRDSTPCVECKVKWLRSETDW